MFSFQKEMFCSPLNKIITMKMSHCKSILGRKRFGADERNLLFQYLNNSAVVWHGLFAYRQR